MRGEDSARRVRLSCPSMKAFATHPRIKTLLENSLLPAARVVLKTKSKGGNSSKTRRLVTRQQSTKRWLEQHGVGVVEDWPTKGDHINPMENLWAILDDRLEHKKFRTEEMKKKIRELWDELDSSLYTTSFTPYQTVCAELGRLREAQ